jgi:hypothetical protein
VTCYCRRSVPICRSTSCRRAFLVLPLNPFIMSAKLLVRCLHYHYYCLHSNTYTPPTTMSAFQQALASASSSQQQGGSSSSIAIRGSASTGGPSGRGLASALRGIKKDGTPGMEVDGASTGSGRSARGTGSGRRATIGSTGYIPNQVSMHS